jgi:hypothetical protein
VDLSKILKNSFATFPIDKQLTKSLKLSLNYQENDFTAALKESRIPANGV